MKSSFDTIDPALEEQITKRKAVELFDAKQLDMLEVGTFRTLAHIHTFLFGDLYDFAGHIRSVNIAKGSFQFASALYMDMVLQTIDQMPQRTFDQIVEKYIEMNVAHPFRDGNGRSMRIWLDHILKAELGQVIDWSKVPQTDYLTAMTHSPVSDNAIKYLLEAALTYRIDDRDLYLNGIDVSWDYEGFSQTKVLHEE